jgi:hypothetical protein
MTPLWILLFIICLPKTGSTGENPADHGHYTHDAAMISRLHDAHHFWRQEHQTLASEGRGIGENAKINKKAGDEREKQGQKKKKNREHKKKTEVEGSFWPATTPSSPSSSQSSETSDERTEERTREDGETEQGELKKNRGKKPKNKQKTEEERGHWKITQGKTKTKEIQSNWGGLFQKRKH